MRLRRSGRAMACAVLVLLCSHRVAAQETSTVEKCGKSFGTITVADPRTGLGQLQQFGLGSPTALLRTMIQQSACFDVVERGVAMQNLQQERALAQSGALRADANIGQGQMQVADFVMTPDVQIPASTTGGVGGGLPVLGKIGGLLGGLAGGMKFREATTSLLIADVRSSIQVAGAEGKASKTEFSVGGWALTGVGAGTLGGYTSSPEGKLVAASLLDNYNRIVASIRDRAQLIKPSTAESVANAESSTRAEAPVPAGQMFVPKIANVKVYAQPSRDSTVVATLPRGEELIASGEAKDGFLRVDAANFSGWVQRTLVAPTAGSVTTTMPAAATLAPVPLGLPVPAMRYGQFVGTLDGADRGSFRVLIDNDGGVTGDGSFARMGAFGLMGKYDAVKGTLVMQGGSSGGNMIFMGRYDPTRGAIVGNWNLGGAAALMTGGGGGGSFIAQSQ